MYLGLLIFGLWFINFAFPGLPFITMFGEWYILPIGTFLVLFGMMAPNIIIPGIVAIFVAVIMMLSSVV